MNPEVGPRPIEIAIPDAGPLITLAVGGALKLLLVAHDEVEIVLTDYVKFEVTALPNRYMDAGVIKDFLEQNKTRVKVEPTGYGKLAIPAIRGKLRKGVGPKEAFPEDGGEHSIMSFIRATKDRNPGKPTLVLIEDAWFEENAYAVPGNVHLLSTMAFLKGLESIKKIASAEAVKRQILAAGRNFMRTTKLPGGKKITTDFILDKPAAKIPGGTAWKPRFK